jgi:glycosyltransferase 2 family protein
VTPQKKPKKAPAPPPAAEQAPPRNNRRPWYIALLVAGVLLLGASAALAMLGTFSELEQRLFNVINQVDLPAWVTSQVAKPLSNAVWGMVILVGVLLIVPKYRLIAWQYAVAAGATRAVVLAFEFIVDRARPAGLYEDVVLRAQQGGVGFPSGHVSVLLALAITMWPFVSWPWRVPILVLVGAEAWSRIFLGLHAPLDVIGGIGAAMAVVAAIHLTPAKIRKIFRIAA